ncbi:hypothetical protein, partial [Ligilactobacillus acidipiscis]|uniref:hypothetical protein n=2 Tax=Ligilactobacillus acidipiscis TaxID=89059 RepID=UPI0022E27CAD
ACRENLSTKGLRHYDKRFSCRDVRVDWAESSGMSSSTIKTEQSMAGELEHYRTSTTWCVLGTVLLKLDRRNFLLARARLLKQSGAWRTEGEH